jgi:hypothetical protein
MIYVKVVLDVIILYLRGLMNLYRYFPYFGARGGAIGWGNALQAGRSSLTEMSIFWG